MLNRAFTSIAKRKMGTFFNRSRDYRPEVNTKTILLASAAGTIAGAALANKDNRVDGATVGCLLGLAAVAAFEGPVAFLPLALAGSIVSNSFFDRRSRKLNQKEKIDETPSKGPGCKK